ncbi:MAG: hypothetical protein B6I35_10955 [Anaerolineaceae bacterium 4572_32.2]|nr:MAG: hypothetical protein B6I35_10955 [Anaerolineaceae bacterium 4572_32.2]
MVKIGVISDTHGYFHPRLPTVLEGVSLILHAGDVGRPDVIRRLEAIAPVRAVRGNMDSNLRPPRFPARQLVRAEQITLLVTHLGLWSESLRAWLHQEHDLDNPDVFIYGHTHRASRRWQDGILYFNPGAAGRSRVGREASVGILSVQGQEVEGYIIPLRLP